MPVPFTDWVIITPYPPGGTPGGAVGEALSWLHIDLTKGNTGSGWIAWFQEPPNGAGLGGNQVIPVGGMPVQVAYDPSSSYFTISSIAVSPPEGGLSASLTGVWVTLPVGSKIAINFPPQSAIFFAGQGTDMVSGVFNFVEYLEMVKNKFGFPQVKAVGLFDQPWLAVPITVQKFE